MCEEYYELNFEQFFSVNLDSSRVECWLEVIAKAVEVNGQWLGSWDSENILCLELEPLTWFIFSQIECGQEELGPFFVLFLEQPGKMQMAVFCWS